MNNTSFPFVALFCYADVKKKDSPPTACFTVPDEIFMDEPVVFSSCSENDENRQWDFGDSSYSDAKNPEHVFSNAGIHTVALRTVNEEGMDVQTRNVSVMRYQLKSAELKSLSYPSNENCHYIFLYLGNAISARSKYPCQMECSRFLLSILTETW